MDLVWVDPADYESAGRTFVVVQTENLIYSGNKRGMNQKPQEVKRKKKLAIF